MNMKPGEMGVVVRTCAMGGGARVPQEALGLVVRVSELVGTEFGPSWALSVPATFVAQKDYTAQFADGPGRVCRGGYRARLSYPGRGVAATARSAGRHDK